MALADSDATSTCGEVSKSPDDLTFTGTSAAECERFISDVRKHAYLHGKQRDDEWITDLVASCLTGKALKWHVMLPSQIAWHWGRLQQAMIERFAPIVEETVEGSMTSPESQQINHSLTCSGMSTLRAFVIEAASFGLVQVQSVQSAVPTYISNSVNNLGRLYLTQNINEALRVRFPRSVQPHNIQIVNLDTSTASDLNHLGVTRVADDSSIIVCADECFYLTLTNRSLQSTSWRRTSGPTNAAVWTVSENNLVRASWNSIDLIPLVGIAPSKYPFNNNDITHPIITMVVNETEFSKQYQGGSFKYSKAEMVFKPLKHLYDQYPAKTENYGNI
ncbi:hypothetical protein FRB94_013211 [Tulasnella sp. JGI-2019a]|nr:hypothetical protein FRB93_011795 [Tulasnella sp. JGI-2019a]KAG9008487.1 hypothetical protein FRB94_013211 [Tulasnella sp. JGI-2019a]